mgnify:CR=1 FL=1
MVVVGLHPNCDIQALQRQYIGRKSEGSGRFSSQNHYRIEPNIEPQVGILLPNGQFICIVMLGSNLSARC